MRYYTNETLGPKRSKTPEGFLVCHDVPIARVGVMHYADHELPLEPNGSGVLTVERGADALFTADTLASFEGKPVTLDHPSDFVGPGNWSKLAKGVTQNVHRGAGFDQDVILADLLITDADAISEIEGGRREVSCGYEAEYEQSGPGRGVQRNIIGNHVALVERGRCGPRCAIGDKEKSDMSKKPWRDRIRDAFKSKDEASLEAALKTADAEKDEDEDEEEGKSKTGDADVLAAIKGLSARFDTIDARLSELETRDEGEDDEKEKTEDEDEDEGEDEDDKAKTGDCAAMFRDAVSRAEIIAPGLRLPTFDAKSGASKTRDAICDCKRRALLSALATDAGKSIADPFLKGRALDKLSADALDAVFVGVSEVMRHRNNDAGKPKAVSTKDFGRPTNVAAINERNRAFWSKAN